MLAVIGAGMVIFTLNSAKTIGESRYTAADMQTLPVIIIDPGHGGMDGGAVGVDGQIEKDINLAISLTLRDMFVASGFEVIMTRETDMSIHDEGANTARKQKVSDLHNRLKIAEDNPNSIFISIHQNKFGSQKSWGTQVFYSPNAEQSGVLAKIVQRRMVADLQPDNKREVKKAEKNLYLLFNAKCPAILIECGFLSNPEEARRLEGAEYQRELAFSAMCAVLEYLDLDVDTTENAGELSAAKDEQSSLEDQTQEEG